MPCSLQCNILGQVCCSLGEDIDVGPDAEYLIATEHDFKFSRFDHFAGPSPSRVKKRQLQLGTNKRGSVSTRARGGACDWCGRMERCGCAAALDSWLCPDAEEFIACDKADKLAESDTSTIAPDDKPDFNGDWLLAEIDGDMEDLMYDAGVGMVMRKLARGANFGVGMFHMKITQNGDKFIITVEALGMTTQTSEFTVGQGEQKTVWEDGQACCVKPVWDGVNLNISGKFTNGSTMQFSRRYVENDEMVVASTTSKGVVIKRIFRKA